MLPSFTALIAHVLQHLKLAYGSLLVGILIGFPLAIFITRERFRKSAGYIISIADAMAAIPAFALLAIVVPLIGLGVLPAILALITRAVMPILRSTVTGITQIDPGIKKAAKGMGLSDREILKKIELPLSIPFIIGGIRTAGVLTVGVAIIASLIGAGGMGEYLFLGITSLDFRLIVISAIPVSILALATEFGFRRLEDYLAPPGIGT